MNDFTKEELDELKKWYEQAGTVICGLNKDKIADIMTVAYALRQAYLEGKNDGVKEWNAGPR